MKFLKVSLIILLTIFMGLQFVRPVLNKGSGQSHFDIDKTIQVPRSVMKLLTESCYDCHSNNTRYPWYANIQPLGYLISRDVRNGKKELNFNQWGTYSNRKQKNKLRSISSQIRDKKMPLPQYTLIHRDAKLNDKDIKVIRDFIDQFIEMVPEM